MAVLGGLYSTAGWQGRFLLIVGAEMVRRLTHAIFFLVYLVLMPVAFAQDTDISKAIALRNFFKVGVERNAIVGASVKVLRDGVIVAEDSRGLARKSDLMPVDDNTAFHWASITKTFTAIAILQLRDRGKLQLDDSVVKYVPELAAVYDPWGSVHDITIRHLLTHSAGFRSATWPWRDDKQWQPFEPTRWSQIVAMLPYTEVEFLPGSKFHYSNLGIIFLGQIIERLSGDDYEMYIEKNILKPLEMYSTYFDRAPYHLLKNRSASYSLEDGKLTEGPFDFDTGITASNGGLNGPLLDMTKYLRFLLGDPLHGELYNHILMRSSLEEMFKKQIAIEPTPLPAGEPIIPQSVGLSFFILEENGRRFIGHSGSQNGFISHIYIEPESHCAYVVAFNTDAKDPDHNTGRFNRELREFIFAQFFRSGDSK